MELVSIIVLGYNVEKYINRCLVSLANQIYRNIELIVLDDCSSDNTWNVINESIRSLAFNHINVLLHRNNENKGSASCRNIGISLASGDYFTFVDGDDWIEPDGIINMVKSAHNTQADIVMSDFIMDRDGRTYIAKQNAGISSNIEIIKSILLGKIHGSVCNKLYKTKLADSYSIKFVDGADYTEDLAFNVKFLAYTDNIAYNSVPYYHYCIRPESMSREQFNKKDEINPKDLQKIRNLQSVTCELQKSGIISQVKNELNYCKLGARLPLLNYPNKEKCKLWQTTFPESNATILFYDRIGFIYRLKLLLLILKLNSLFLFANKL